MKMKNIVCGLIASLSLPFVACNDLDLYPLSQPSNETW